MATRVEIIKDLVDVVKADYTKAVTIKKMGCPDCGGSGQKGNNEVNLTTCAVCNGEGVVDEEVCMVADIPLRMRKFVTGFKLGRQGRLMPEFRSKDKAATDLIKVLGLDKPTLRAMRDANGEDLKPDQMDDKEQEIRDMIADPEMARRNLLMHLYDVMQTSASAVERIAANRQIAILLGLVVNDEVGEVEGAIHQPGTPWAATIGEAHGLADAPSQES